MISLFCLLLPFAGSCPAYVANVPAVSAVVRHQAAYSGKIIKVTGRVRRLEQWKARDGRPEEVFSVCDNACVRVFMRAHSAIAEGQRVTVRGPYYQAYHVGKHTYYNEIEATSAFPHS